MKNVILLVSTFLSLVCTASDWGIGVGGISIPHYFGSTEHYQLVGPFPYVSAGNIQFNSNPKGTVLMWDGEFLLPVSGDSLNSLEPEGYSNENQIVRSSKNYARRGMGFLPASAFMGVKIGYNFGPVSLVYSALPGVQLGQGWDSAGLIQKLRLDIFIFENSSIKEASCLCFYVEALSTDSIFNQLYYGVDSQYVLPGRAEFDAQISGFLGTKVGFYFVKRLGDFGITIFAEQQNLKSSVVKDSPIISQKTGLNGAAAIVLFF
ncbi:MAG: MipA/OmpV family protein [Bdellovibrionales bacterium]